MQFAACFALDISNFLQSIDFFVNSIYIITRRFLPKRLPASLRGVGNGNLLWQNQKITVKTEKFRRKFP